MFPPKIVPVERLDFHLTPWEWPFATERRDAIAAYFKEVQADKPAIWNGRVFAVRRHEFAGTTLRGEFFETWFADLLAWRDWGYPDPSIDTAFSMAAIETADKSYLVGEMGAHTANAGKIYFPTGTPDREDLDGDIVDLDRSVRRELREETGLAFDDFDAEPNWHVVLSGKHIAIIKRLRSRESKTALGDRVRRFLAQDSEPEFSDLHFLSGPDDLSPAVPPYVQAFLTQSWRAGA